MTRGSVVRLTESQNGKRRFPENHLEIVTRTPVRRRACMTLRCAHSAESPEPWLRAHGVRSVASLFIAARKRISPRAAHHANNNVALNMLGSNHRKPP